MCSWYWRNSSWTDESRRYILRSTNGYLLWAAWNYFSKVIIYKNERGVCDSFQRIIELLRLESSSLSPFFLCFLSCVMLWSAGWMQTSRNILPTLKMEAECFAVLLVPTHLTTWCHDPECYNMNFYCGGKFKSHLTLFWQGYLCALIK